MARCAIVRLCGVGQVRVRQGEAGYGMDAIIPVRCVWRGRDRHGGAVQGNVRLGAARSGSVGQGLMLL